MKLSEKQIQAIIALPAPKRYSHFIKTVVNWGEAWGLFDNGWVLKETDQGQKLFPLWPAEEYALLCAKDDWCNAKPKAIPLEEILEELLPTLSETDMLPGIFPIPTGYTTMPDIDLLTNDLLQESERYE